MCCCSLQLRDWWTSRITFYVVKGSETTYFPLLCWILLEPMIIRNSGWICEWQFIVHTEMVLNCLDVLIRIWEKPQPRNLLCVTVVRATRFHRGKCFVPNLFSRTSLEDEHPFVDVHMIVTIGQNTFINKSAIIIYFLCLRDGCCLLCLRASSTWVG